MVKIVITHGRWRMSSKYKDKLITWENGGATARSNYRAFPFPIALQVLVVQVHGRSLVEARWFCFRPLLASVFEPFPMQVLFVPFPALRINNMSGRTLQWLWPAHPPGIIYKVWHIDFRPRDPMTCQHDMLLIHSQTRRVSSINFRCRELVKAKVRTSVRPQFALTRDQEGIALLVRTPWSHDMP